ncbi:MAG TPA: neutral zinc metallopeptidase, partial [Prevotella sp.]
MRLTGRRESNNVEDRRGMSGGTKAGIGGIGGLIIMALITYFMGGNPLDVVQQAGGLSGLQEQTSPQAEHQFTAEEEELAKFSRQILAGTEDVWTEVFRSMGRTYTPPTLVLFTDGVQSACGNATAAVGPFY